MSGSAQCGDDTLTGGDNSGSGTVYNYLFGDAETMSDSAQGGNDTLTGGDNSGSGFVSNYLYGDARIMSGSAQGGNDTITGGNYINLIWGDAWQMFSSTGGNDNLTVGGSSLIYGDASFMSSSTGGDDTITGGGYGDADAMSSCTGGNDTITGGSLLVGDANQTSEGHSTGGNDTLTGGIGGSNTLIGDIAYVFAGASVQGGDDRLVSAENTPDDMWGDFQNVVGGTVTGGHDTFAFGPGNGNDILHDFRQGEDVIELAGFLAVPMSEIGADQMSLRAASQLLGLTIETVDANQDGSTDSVIHFDASGCS